MLMTEFRVASAALRADDNYAPGNSFPRLMTPTRSAAPRPGPPTALWPVAAPPPPRGTNRHFRHYSLIRLRISTDISSRVDEQETKEPFSPSKGGRRVDLDYLPPDVKLI